MTTYLVTYRYGNCGSGAAPQRLRVDAPDAMTAMRDARQQADAEAVLSCEIMDCRVWGVAEQSNAE